MTIHQGQKNISSKKSFLMWRYLKSLHQFYENRFTPAGKALLIIVFIAHFLGATGTVIPVYLLALGLMAFATAVLAEGFVFRPHSLMAERRAPNPVTAGHEATWSLYLTNQHNRPLFYGELMEQFMHTNSQSLHRVAQTLPTYIAPGETVKVQFQYLFLERGVYHFHNLVVLSYFPFHLFKWQKEMPHHGSLVVYPQYRPLHELQLHLGRKYQRGGILISSDVGDSVEFMGIRNYVAGDNPKYVHWPTLAKTNELGTKEFHEEYFIRLGLLIDSESAQGVPFQSFETAISLTASIADWAARQDYIIDIFATGQTFYRFQAGRSLGHLSNILEILACLTPSETVDFEQLWHELGDELPHLSAMICVFLQWDEARQHLIQLLTQLDIGVKVILIAEESPVEVDASIAQNMTVVSPEQWDAHHL